MQPSLPDRQRSSSFGTRKAQRCQWSLVNRRCRSGLRRHVLQLFCCSCQGGWKPRLGNCTPRARAAGNRHEDRHGRLWATPYSYRMDVSLHSGCKSGEVGRLLFDKYVYCCKFQYGCFFFYILTAWTHTYRHIPLVAANRNDLCKGWKVRRKRDLWILLQPGNQVYTDGHTCCSAAIEFPHVSDTVEMLRQQVRKEISSRAYKIL